MKLDHLTDEDHAEAARLLKEVQDNLKSLTRVVGRAPWTDRVMLVMKGVQERLIDPLSQARDTSRERREIYAREEVYPSVYYSVRR
jgi:hypothetical protein